MFKHFLLTRFNLRIEDWETTKNGDQVLSEAWLIDRFRLFETYCLPSVRNQRNQNFTWFVYFDKETPDKFKHKIEQFSKGYPNLKPVFIDAGIAAFRRSIIENIMASIDDEDEYIMTTRLDNDDLIHQDFISTIQSLFQPINNHIIDLRIGYQLIIDDHKGEILHHKNNFNPYISLVESKGEVKSIFSRDHKNWKDAISVTIYDEKELWMTLIHQNNKLNRRNSKAKGIYLLDSREFGIDNEKLILKNVVNIFLTNLKVDLRTGMSLCKRVIKSTLSNT